MDKNVLVTDENRSFAGPSGTPSGAVAACWNLNRTVLTSELRGNLNPGISCVQSLGIKIAGYGGKVSLIKKKASFMIISALYG